MHKCFFVKSHLILLACLLPVTALASDTDVVRVEVKYDNARFHFDVTLRHADTGWDHYANVWEVVDSDGNILATRVLAHPHVNEQPFTRSLGGVEIAINIREVTIRAGDNVNGLGGKTISVTLPQRN